MSKNCAVFFPITHALYCPCVPIQRSTGNFNHCLLRGIARTLIISPLPESVPSKNIFIVIARLLMASEAHYRDLFGSASDDIFIRNLEGNIIEVNRAVSALTSYTLNELAKMSII